MLFLAVLCGSLAEYQLEHKIEHEQEVQYIESMVSDMKEDYHKIQTSSRFCKAQLAAFDTILRNVYNTPYTDSSLRALYKLQRQYGGTRGFVVFTKRTIVQLKGSGGLRLIRNKAASDSIVFYDEACEIIEAQANYWTDVRAGKINDYSIQLFNYQYFTGYGLKSDAKIKLLSDNDQLIKQYANSISHASGSLRNYIFMLDNLEKRIPGMIAFLEKKYHLEANKKG